MGTVTLYCSLTTLPSGVVRLRVRVSVLYCTRKLRRTIRPSLKEASIWMGGKPAGGAGRGFGTGAGATNPAARTVSSSGGVMDGPPGDAGVAMTPTVRA